MKCHVCAGPFATHHVFLLERADDHTSHIRAVGRWVHRACCPTCHPEHLKGTTG